MPAKRNANHSTEPQPKTARKTKKIEAQAPVEPSNREHGLMIVGIGASAGGLQAMQTFFKTLPDDTGMAFVVITHLHPEHESHLAELLQKQTGMPTRQVAEKVKVEPNHIYVIPPNRSMLMTDTYLDISEFREPHGQRTPIDHFFRSLARSKRDPVAIILSGGGTDGSVGIKDVKEAGGLLMVQHPEDAEYDSMPRAAISTGLADVVLPATQLAERLVEYGRHRPELPRDPRQLNGQDLETLQRILAQVHARTGHDFAQYKRSTILRRVERRMQLNGFTTLETYLDYLRHHTNEAQAMFNDILIGVTNFFRDRASWEALETKVIPALFAKKDNGAVIRVWSIGCATGEEAYGLAMLLLEQAARIEFRLNMQIFASDLDERSITHARLGLYPTAIEADVSPQRLERFFTREGEYYRIKRELRDMVLFTSHNALRDPPFSRQDLIACRNVLIYMERDVQDKVFDVFHYALNPQGYLFLGSSESAEHLPELYGVVDKTHRIYQAKPWRGARPHVPSMPLTMERGLRSAQPPGISRPHLVRLLEDPVGLEQQHEKTLEAYGPPSILIDERYAILHVSDTAGRYLLQPRGPITGDLLKLVRPELQLELRTALFRAFEKDQATLSRPVPVQFNGHARRVILFIRPRSEVAEQTRLPEKQALIFFLENQLEEQEPPETELDQPHDQAEQDKLVSELQVEIQRLREQLQITSVEYDSSNEEMKAANEELQSINEEYRSATEELETSKEELQSVNEELQTVNNEMKSKLEEITQAHHELENLMGATEIATLFLDRDLRIQRYTRVIKDLFNIMPSDRGRPINHLTHRLNYNGFTRDAEQVLRRLIPVEREIQAENGGWYLLRLSPYRTVLDRIEGVVISFIDISERKRAEQELIGVNEALEERVLERTRQLQEANHRLTQARDMFYALFHANPIPTALTRLNDNVYLNANIEFLNYFGLQREDVIGHSAEELNLELGLRTLAQEKLSTPAKKGSGVQSYETEIRLSSGETRNIIVSIQDISLEDIEALIATFIDITDRVRAEQQIRSLASELTATEQTERHRLSQILHDDLQQRIFAIQMQMSFLQDAYEKNDLQAFAVDFPQLETWLAEAIQVTRQLSVDLSPPILHGEGLVEAILWLAAQMQEQYGLEVNIRPEGIPPSVDEKVRILVFYAVREFLFNVVKHAGTLKAAVDFKSHNDYFHVVVSDQGKGFDPAQVLSNLKIAHGLLLIRHRLNLLGCAMDVKSQPGEGTQIIIEVPHGLEDN